jgi:hypothetical protein
MDGCFYFFQPPTMRKLAIFLSLLFVVEATAQERNYESMMTGTTFRGRTLIFESQRNPDGTYTDNYRDIEGNPLTETERYFVDGHNRLAASRSFHEFGTTIRESDRPSLLSIMQYGENPEFREYTGITLEQISEIYLELWNIKEEFPSDELLDITVRAGMTEDTEELAEIATEFVSYHANQRENIIEHNKSMLAIFSPEQIQKLWEVEFARFWDHDSAINPNFRLYNALELTEEQKEQVQALRTEFWEKHAELLKMTNRSERNAKLDELGKTIRSQLRATLTDTQRAKMDRLLTDKPAFLTAQATPPQEKKIEEDEYDWSKSWNPGDPIPEGRLPPRPPPGLFPRLAL